MTEYQEPPSPFELRWGIFGIRFRVFPSFFLVYGLIIGLIVWLQFAPPDPVTLALAVGINLACVTVAILFVSFVQGLVYRSYGLRSTVVIREFFSGVRPEAEPRTALQRIAVELAYPGACLLLAALLYYTDQQFGWSKTSPLTDIMYLVLFLIALFWAAITLLPIYPYPGGKIMLEVFTLISPRNGLVMTLAVSILVGVAYIAYAVLVHLGRLPNYRVWGGRVPLASIFVAVFFAFSVMQNWQLLGLARAQRRQYSRYDDPDDDRSPWER